MVAKARYFGASRLARFNITSNAQPSNPGRPGKKYFVGMPIPAGAGVIAAVVHFEGGEPIASWYMALTWLAMIAVVGYLMVSTWRFYSFKDLPWTRKQPSLAIVMIALLGAAMWRWSEEVLLLIAATYTATGVTLHIVRLLRHRLVSRTA